jgi:Transglycosylase SLT domain
VSPSASVSESVGSSPSASAAVTPTPIATSPDSMAAQLAQVATNLRAAIAAWQAAGGTTSWPPPEDVVLLSLTQQKLYGTLSLHPRLYRRVLPLISADLRSQAEANVSAGAQLISLVAPSSAAVTFKTKAPLPADTLLRYYKQAQARFGVPWQVLAAVNFIESRFGRVISNSYAGAQGPMQFIPSTWDAYGLGGNVRVPRDAILGAANYLHASGSPGNDAGALFHYNPARAYVRAIMLYAGQMRLDPATFYEYYNWQVFVLTPSGLKQLTGPGS